MNNTDIAAARAEFQKHRFEWFPPDPPSTRNSKYLCLGCGWSVEIDGYADDPRGLDHRLRMALETATPTRK